MTLSKVAAKHRGRIRASHPAAIGLNLGSAKIFHFTGAQYLRLNSSSTKQQGILRMQLVATSRA